VAFANASPLATFWLPMVTVTLCWRSDAWMTWTSAFPGGVLSWSSITCSRSALAGPMPATV
jgi:hypothetical protein